MTMEFKGMITEYPPQLNCIDMGAMTHWTETVFYSIAHDCDMARINGFDSHGLAHWIEIPTGRGYRDRRFEALEQIQESIEAGDLSGEVS